MSGGGASLTSSTSCPTDAERSQAITVSDGQPVVTADCNVKAFLCSGACPGGSLAAGLHWKVTNLDGPVQIRFLDSSDASISFMRKFVMFNAKS